MFQENTEHKQPSLFGIANQFSPEKLERLKKSKEYYFYHMVFCNIREKDFEVLFSKEYSRPNAPVNSLVSAIILMTHHGWSINELFRQIDFNILIRAALGLDGINEMPFCQATYFNFQNRLLSYKEQTGIDLIERVFDSLTAIQLKTLKVKTDIQRTDSFMAMSSIRSYSRTQLLVENLLRMHRVLSSEDKSRFGELLSPYMNQDSEHFVYELSRDQVPHELKKLGGVYHKLYGELKPRYGELDEFEAFERAYQEHFTVKKNKVRVKDSSKLTGGTMQSPDDLDATYRMKNGKHFRGQSVNITETASPENELNLITDIAVKPNVTDDSEILGGRMEHLKEKTPDLKELHTDGAYGSEENDKKMEQLKITHVQTAVRGRIAGVSMEIEEVTDGEYQVRCPHQKVKSQKTKKGYKAIFDLAICRRCSLVKKCCTTKQKHGRVYYFDRANYLLQKRVANIKNLPPERQKLRPNIEATVKEFTCGFNHKGKLKVKGRFKTMLYACSVGIAINFGRVWRYLMENPQDLCLFRRIYCLFDKIFLRKDGFWRRVKTIFTKIADFACPRVYKGQSA
jgi:Transposase domain (DUF772)